MQYDFMSRYDRFSVDVTQGRALFNGQRVSAKPFVYIEPLFNTELLDDCSAATLRKKPDLTIIRQADKRAAAPFTTKRLVYFKSRLVSDGKHCAPVIGQEFYLLPLHRKWFTNSHERKSVAIGDTLTVRAQGKSLESFVKKDGHWRTKAGTVNVNWDYFSNFINALHDFSVDFRVLPGAARPETKFIIQTNGHAYVFEKVGDKTWALRMPGSAWLIASGDFGVFGQSMSAARWASPYESSLKIVQDDKSSPVARIAALNSLTADALASARPLLGKILDNREEPLELREDIVARLRESPSMANMRVLIQALSPSEDPEFLNAVTEALRIRNPKGPVIYSNDNSDQISAKIGEWQKWQAH